MKKTAIIIISFLMALPLFASEPAAKSDEPVKEHLQNHFKMYGFVRNYFVFDSRESKAGTGDLFYYLPLDNKWNTANKLNEAREDLNASPSFRFLSLTSRLGVDVSGYHIGNLHFGAKIEGDFYAGLTSLTDSKVVGLSGNTKVSGTAQARLRQAYATLTWKDLPMGEKQMASVGLKIGQAWHPMAADHPHLFSLEVGAPFGPFSRTPLVQMDANLGKNWVVSAAAIWQMQYQSAGPSGASAEYMKYGCTPEVYAAVGYKVNGFQVRLGADVVSIKPRNIGTNSKKLQIHVSDRKTSLLYYLYAQYSKGKFAVKAKSVFGEGGEHMNLMSGYAKVGELEDGSWEYASLRNTSSWVSLSYGKKWQGVLFLGYVKNLGLAEKVDAPYLNSSDVYFCSNGFSNINQMYRINPQVIYNIGKLNVGLEYQFTGVQYGNYLNGEYEFGGEIYEIKNGLHPRGVARGYKDESGQDVFNLHWVGNHRVNLMVKYNF